MKTKEKKYKYKKIINLLVTKENKLKNNYFHS